MHLAINWFFHRVKHSAFCCCGGQRVEARLAEAWTAVYHIFFSPVLHFMHFLAPRVIFCYTSFHSEGSCSLREWMEVFSLAVYGMKSYSLTQNVSIWMLKPDEKFFSEKVTRTYILSSPKLHEISAWQCLRLYLTRHVLGEHNEEKLSKQHFFFRMSMGMWLWFASCSSSHPVTNTFWWFSFFFFLSGSPVDLAGVKIKKRCYFGDRGIAEIIKKKVLKTLSLSLFAPRLKAKAQMDKVTEGKLCLNAALLGQEENLE